MGKQFCWIFDPERCVGCHACTVACKSENNTNPNTSEMPDGPDWRWVVTQRSGKFSLTNPSYQEFFTSMACYHCAAPACQKACPVGAISKAADTGLVTIDQSKCVGCKRCSWACPYGAPRFNLMTKKMEKCTGCRHKLLNKGDGTYDYTAPPACVSTCPGRALRFEWLSVALTKTQTGAAPEGFAHPRLTRPQVQFVK